MDFTRMDFERARRKAMWNSLIAAMRLRPSSLVSMAEVDRECSPAGQAQGGVQQVSLGLILGSVNRSHDFDMDFNPLTKVMRDRWERVNQAVLGDIPLPPVQLRKVGDEYFVVDGHHRVSVAKYHGMVFIDAEVYEYMCASEAA
jgi:hypothetical protein